MAAPMQDCILLMGDSLTQRTDSPGNLQQRMNEAYQRKLDILNRGYGGFNSEWFVPLLPKILARKEDADKVPVIRLVTIWLGTNDSVIGRDQSQSTSRLVSNLEIILDALTSPESPYAVASTPVSIILMTPGPCVVSDMPKENQKYRTAEKHREYRDAVIEVGEKYKALEEENNARLGDRYGWKIATADVWQELMSAAAGDNEQELSSLFIDGVHLSTKGYTVVWDLLARIIKTEFKGRGLDWEDFDDLPRRVPPFTDIDFSNPPSVVDLMALPKIRQ
ncbi:SGNH hydrolase-type esterase domain-containing protein [Kockovaella imperatae]|uniref:SGNH hydrolase-type esterase domain-containing protein n=1 Tax=Kockovaella imperatae TaxID=4999 RepID=A0A1Y1UBJ8_9TREE|nr:SGNH hydrolase-type esterase domain-containing protein [Kockovaella imperatae]ORX35420.1 SGNH hydrolase-type esterase domain-containing protein [Kockovaella imperatae]